MNYEQLWEENDEKVEDLALQMKLLRIDYIKKRPNASPQEISRYINNKLNKEVEILFKEQMDIIKSSTNL